MRFTSRTPLFQRQTTCRRARLWPTHGVQHVQGHNSVRFLRCRALDEAGTVGATWSFDSERAYRHTAALCFPRQVGTRAEHRAARYIRRVFAAAGLTTRAERFRVSFFPTEI